MKQSTVAVTITKLMLYGFHKMMMIICLHSFYGHVCSVFFAKRTAFLKYGRKKSFTAGHSEIPLLTSASVMKEGEG